MIDFKAPYSRASALGFLDNFLPDDFQRHDEEIKLDFKPQFIRHIRKIGEVASLENALIYEITHESENDPRVSLSKDSFHLLANFNVRKALIFFVSQNSSNYRLSLVTVDLKWESGARVKREYSNPRRYSFFLGPDAKVHTPEEYLIKRGRVCNFEDLTKRFSIEVVNKEFYLEIAKLFTLLAGGKREFGRKSIDAGDGALKLPSTTDDIIHKEFTVRLIGRLVFCWFLKKKQSDKGMALLSDDLLSVKAVRENNNYYHSVLEPLFFEVLNTQVGKRGEQYKKTPWNQIPFLNGGLFNPHAHDYYDLGSFGFSKHINSLKIPDNWFEDLFKIFETYNFTIDENTSVDVELAIEPEMLGRIFENLLAEINPETGETARKATGSYYTPRPIVEYMVDESLKQYLLAKTGLSEDNIFTLLAYDDSDIGLNEKEREKVIGALDAIKIIDPACGSGAFPMGYLQKMLLVLQKIDPESQGWLDKKLASISDTALRKDLKAKLKVDNFNYIHKIGIIRDSIYGVDIQPIAVEISKLRFFLSLIVDEKVNDMKENRGIEPLPNLEFKFVCANSLIGLPKNGHQESFTEATEDIAILKSLRDEYLRSYGYEKKRLEKKFLEVQSRMAKHALSWALWGSEKSQTMKLSQWDPFSEEPCVWFDPEWMFGVKDGFDIIIANPPYIDSEAMVNAGQKSFREVILQTYMMTKGNWDIYIAFFELGFKLMNSDGVLTFITPDKWISKPFGDELRKIKISNISVLLRAGRKVFESAKVDSIISFFSNKQCSDIKILDYDGGQFVFKRVIKKSSLNPPFALDHLFSDSLDLLSKIERSKNKLSDFSNSENACATSDAYKLEPFISELSDNKFDPKKYFKIINTGTIGRFCMKWGIREMTYLKHKYLYPVVDREKFLVAFPNSYGKKSTQPKIVLKGLNLLDACLDKDGIVIPGKTTLIIASSDIQKLKFLLAILNSKLPLFYIKERYPASSYNQGTTFTKEMIDNLPVPDISESKKSQLVDIVDKIISTGIARTEDDKKIIEKYEYQINDIIMELYGLSPGEISLINKSFE